MSLIPKQPKKLTPEVLAERKWFADQVKTAKNPTPEELKAQEKGQEEFGKAFPDF